MGNLNSFFTRQIFLFKMLYYIVQYQSMLISATQPLAFPYAIYYISGNGYFINYQSNFSHNFIGVICKKVSIIPMKLVIRKCVCCIVTFRVQQLQQIILNFKTNLILNEQFLFKVCITERSGVSVKRNKKHSSYSFIC